MPELRIPIPFHVFQVCNVLVACVDLPAIFSPKVRFPTFPAFPRKYEHRLLREAPALAALVHARSVRQRNLREAGPVYRERGRMRRLLSSCSITWALQPTTRL